MINILLFDICAVFTFSKKKNYFKGYFRKICSKKTYLLIQKKYIKNVFSQDRSYLAAKLVSIIRQMLYSYCNLFSFMQDS